MTPGNPLYATFRNQVTTILSGPSTPTVPLPQILGLPSPIRAPTTPTLKPATRRWSTKARGKLGINALLELLYWHISIIMGPLDQIRKIAGCACVGIAGDFYLPPTLKETASYRSRHAPRHVPCMSGSLTRADRESSRHSRRMHNPQFYVFAKRPMKRSLQHPTDLEIEYQ